MKILTAWLRSYLPALPVDDLQLAEDLTLRGIAVEGVHGLGPGHGHLFEMDITTNRVDAMNHYGIAREAAAIYNLPLAALLASAAEPVVSVRGPSFTASPPSAASSSPDFSIVIAPEAESLCGRFTARILRGISVASSTGRVAEYFNLLGLKQILNAVDASNFTLLGMGHPTHAFDLDKIVGGITVRVAHAGETLRLLDGSERTLAGDDLVIADHARAISLAGVMGGWDTMITPATRNILVEAAWFDPAGVRRSARRHGLHTDASHRFERGADFDACPIANALVSDLILQSGGRAEGGLIDLVVPEVAALTSGRAPIQLSVAQVRRHLGRALADTPGQSSLTSELISQYLTALGCTLSLQRTTENEERTTFLVDLPSWRLDLEREIDLIEEVARVFGYNRFANSLPTALPVVAHPLAAAEAAVRARLLALGYSEAISSTFASANDAAAFADAAGASEHSIPVELENPLSEEASLLRPSLVPGMAAMLAHNLNRDVRTARLFETGAVFSSSPDSGAVTECESLVLGFTGELPATPLYAANDAPIFEIKGVLESLLSLFAPARSGAVPFTPEAPAWLEPGRSATALRDGLPIACFGELAAGLREARKLRQPVFLAQVDLAALYALPLRRAIARELSRFQAVERDFSFTFADTLPWSAVSAAIESLSIPELTRLAPIEVFRDPRAAAVPSGHYALLVRCVFQSPERTLREDELTGRSAQIVAALTALGGTMRA